MKKKQWMLGLFGGVLASLATPGFAGDVTTQIKGIEIGGQVRARYDYRGPDTYGNGVARFRDESDDTGMLRTSLSARLDAGDGVTGLIELRDAHVSGTTAIGGDDAGVTVHQGYLNIEDIFGTPVNLKVGRMELNYGDERLLGSSDWSNVSRHFNGATLRYKPMEGTWLDIGYAELVNGDVNLVAARAAGFAPLLPNQVAPAGTGAATSPEQDNDLYYFWLQHNVKDVEVNAYLLWEHDSVRQYASETELHLPLIGEGITGLETIEGLDRYTWGTLVKGKMGNAYMSAEYALQNGDFGRDQIDADMFAGIVGYNVSEMTNVEFEYARASGDRHDFDGTRGGFVAPYPTGHGHLGITDQVGFRNMNAHRVGVGHKLDEKTSLKADWYWFQREDRNDSWYNAANAVVRTGRGGSVVDFYNFQDVDPGHSRQGESASTDLGQEFDLVLNHQYNKFLTLSAGWGHFIAGRFLDETFQDTKDMDYAYVQANLKF